MRSVIFSLFTNHVMCFFSNFASGSIYIKNNQEKKTSIYNLTFFNHLPQINFRHDINIEIRYIEMADVTILLFLYFTIISIRVSSPMSMRELSSNDVIIDVTKGYALQRLGAYSPSLIEQIVHTFIPLDSFCIVSPKTDICLYTSLTKTNMVELVTMMASRQTVHTLSYNKDNISKLITKDISQVLKQHHPDDIIKNVKSNVHLIDNHFYYQKGTDEALIPVSTNTGIDNDSRIQHLTLKTVEKMIKQISSDKIGFDYLSNTDLKLFLRTIFLSIDAAYTISNIQESLDTFAQFIVGQTIFALRYCSLSGQNPLISQPCLVVSTLFLRAPLESTSTFSIYRLIPLPIITNGHKYVYTDLPKLIGISSNHHSVLLWNDEPEANKCTFSPIVQCQQMPVPTSLSKSLCLSQLFDNNQLTTNACQVSRSQNIDQGVMHVANGIWLFYNILQTHYCHIYSASNGLSETIPINESAIVRMPCDKTISCMDVQLFASSCTPYRIIVTPSYTFNIRNLPRFIVPIKTMTQTLVSAYQIQLEESITDLFTAFMSKQSTFYKIIYNYTIYIFSTICFIVLMVIVYILQFIKLKLQRELNNQGTAIQNIMSV